MPALKRKVFLGVGSICASGLLFASVSQAQPSSSAAGDALSRASGPPIMAIVALSEQQITVYSANGPILRALVSSGRPGYETPAGIYSVLQKKAVHYSNLYDDASMPFMQRITWSGIALHAGVVPGHPASHGCVRMPYAFAEQLFGLTKIGMRVVVVRHDIGPVEISHAKLLKPGPIRSLAALSTEATGEISALRSTRLDLRNVEEGDAKTRSWWSIAIAKMAAADVAASRIDEARSIAVKAGVEAAKAVKAQRRMEGARLRLERQLRRLELFPAAVEPLAIVPIDALKIRALEQLSDLDKQLEAFRTEAQPQIDAALAAREQVKLAQTAWVAAQHEAEMAQAKAVPISVFISRKTQRLYARQPSGPIFESDVTIDAPDEPLGTFVFTALAPAPAGAELRWAALAMYADPTNPGIATRQAGARGSTGPTPTNASAAKAALDRISIPPEALEQISEFVSPGSSLIISDEEMSKETGKDTEFVVLLSGELQGGIKIRRRAYSAF
jgi:L,D-transpeptidase catalytic domain